ncbi:MAG: hypothetical protein K5762_05325, partial [Bacilli bacterium]|nr:hypothetical protein [Bacilli bacterium]
NEEKKVVLSLKGQLLSESLISYSSFVIDNTQDDNKDSITTPFPLMDSSFSISIDVTKLNKEGAWYNLYFLINTSQKIYITTEDISPKQLASVMEYTLEDQSKNEYSFEVWNDNVKLVFHEKDNRLTTFYSMNYEIRTENANEYLYFHLRGYNEHENLKLILDGVNSKETDDVLIDGQGNFDIYLRVDDILKDKNTYAIKIEYTLESGSLHTETITNYSLSDTDHLEGICYQSNLYIFRAEITGKKIYYYLSNCPDSFAMDSVSLIQQDGVKLQFSGTVRLFASGFYSFHIRGILQGNDYIKLIGLHDVSSTGYINFTVSLDDMPEYNSLSVTHSNGQLEVYHDTLRLNQFWPGEWSHRKDELGPVEDQTHIYQISDNTYGNAYGITKRPKLG